MYQPKSQESYTVGPSDLNFEFVTKSLGVEASGSEVCKITGTEAAVCTVTLNINIPDVTALSTETVVTLTGSQFNSVNVELTAGLEKLASATAPATGSASGSSSSSSSSAAASVKAASASDSGSGASSIMSNGKGGDVLALVMFSAVVVSAGALMML
ncbi:hypothetical protein E4T39_02015 [Aureobasidium subglaciale]|nr:hypothetical protein E4T39_02015 [Aureobasidium subglaciale]